MDQQVKSKVDTAWLRTAVRDVPDFPKPGILFRDITPLLRDAQRFTAVIDAFAARYRGTSITAIAAVEARGFIFGGPLACALNVGLIPVRKKGKLPWDTSRVTYALEYGTDTVEMHQDACVAGDKIVVIDDVLATGGTSKAAADLITQAQAAVVELAFLIELEALRGRMRLKDYPAFSLLKM